jgi:hypothetical protein
MGLFNDIDFECQCPNCGGDIRGFQSKDGPCDLTTLRPWEVDNFYSSCRSCKAWIEYYRDPTDKDLVEEGLKAVELLSRCSYVVVPEMDDKLFKDIQDFLNTTSYPSGETWLEMYSVKVELREKE